MSLQRKRVSSIGTSWSSWGLRATWGQWSRSWVSVTWPISWPGQAVHSNSHGQLRQREGEEGKRGYFDLFNRRHQTWFLYQLSATSTASSIAITSTAQSQRFQDSQIFGDSSLLDTLTQGWRPDWHLPSYNALLHQGPCQHTVVQDGAEQSVSTGIHTFVQVSEKFGGDWRFAGHDGGPIGQLGSCVCWVFGQAEDEAFKRHRAKKETLESN